MMTHLERAKLYHRGLAATMIRHHEHQEPDQRSTPKFNQANYDAESFRVSIIILDMENEKTR